jgi:hypothetical protein
MTVEGLAFGWTGDLHRVIVAFRLPGIRPGGKGLTAVIAGQGRKGKPTYTHPRKKTNPDQIQHKYPPY